MTNTAPTPGELLSPTPTTPTPPAGQTVNVPVTAQPTASKSNEVILNLPNFNDRFIYGPGNDEFIGGTEDGKKVSRADADKIKKIAEENSVIVVEKDVNGD